MHTQSKNFFCPVEGCKYSVEPNIASLSRYYGSPWHDVRRPLKSKLLADDKDTGYTRYLLYGFHRKDKLLKHLAKHHKVRTSVSFQSLYSLLPQGLEIELSSLLEEKDACQKDPVLAENQKFHSENVNYWELDYALLGRFQRSDGSWSTWSGKSYDRVAALGFKPWVNPGIPQSSNMSKVSYKTDQPAPGSASAYAQGSSSSTSSNAREGIVQLSQGQTMSPFAFQLPRGIHPALSMGQIITNNDDQGVWCPSQQFTQTELFPNHGHANNWIPQSNGFMQTASTAVSAPMSPLSFSDFRTELIAPIQVSEPEGNMTGTSTNMFDFDDMSFEGISGGVYVPANGSYAPAETGQMIPEIFNTGNGEELDSSINTGFDADTWNSSNGSQRW